MAAVVVLTDGELRRKLSEYGVNVGPVTDTTRKLYEKKLERLLAEKNNSSGDIVSSKDTKTRRSLSRGSSSVSERVLLNRSKSPSASPEEISDGELRAKLLEHGVTVGPVTPTTRGLYVKKLQLLVSQPGEGQSNGPAAASKSKPRTSLSRFSSEESDEDDSSSNAMPPPGLPLRSKPRNLGRISASDASRESPQMDIDTDPEPTWKRGSLYPDLSSQSSIDRTGGGILSSSRTSLFGRSPNRFSSNLTSPRDGHYRSDGFETGSDSDAPDTTYSSSKKRSYGSRISPPRSSFLDNFSSLTSKFSSAFSKGNGNREYSSAEDRLSTARRFGIVDSPSSSRSSGFKESGSTGYASAYTQRLSSQLNSPGAASSRYSVPARSSSGSFFHSSPVSANDVKERDAGEETRSVWGSPNGLSSTHSRLSFMRKPRELTQEFKTEDMIRSWFNSQTLSIVVLCLVPLFFLGLAVAYMRVQPSDGVSFYDQEGNSYPICSGDIGSTPCIPPESLRSAVQLARLLLDELTRRAVGVQCQSKSGSSIMSQEEAVMWLDKNDRTGSGNVQTMLTYVKILFLSNPQWGVHIVPVGRIEAAGMDQLADQRNLLALGGLVVRDPQLPLGCYLWLKLSALAFYASILAAGAALVYGGKVLGSWYLNHIRERERAVHDMVRRILALLEANHQSGGQSYLAINHVRDQMIHPWDRDKLAWVWNEAVKFLEHKESRVRCEVQQVAGEEYRVWRWLPTYGSRSPSSTSSSPDHGQALKQNKVWQGQAFETMEGSPNSLQCSPTPCLKIRHMFDPDIEYGEEWPVRIRDAILEKCEGVNILHVSVDRQSREGCVYVKCTSQQDAGMAYKQLHGSWFDGKLVTVKYLRVERYHERFPDAARAVTPLKPSNNMRLSLQMRQETF